MQTEEEILKIKKVKNTAVRTVVLRHLLSQEKAQSLKDIENALAYTDRSSIFRTLKTFEENKVIHSIEDGSGMTKYAEIGRASSRERGRMARVGAGTMREDSIVTTDSSR